MSWFKETFNQTVDFWSQPNATSDALDAINWATTKEGSKIVASKIDESVVSTAEDIKTGIKNVATFGAKTIAVGGAVVIAFLFLASYAKKKGGSLG